MSKLVSISKASEVVGVTVKTLKIWDKEGKLKAYRTVGGHRRYDLEELENHMISKGFKRTKNCIIYARINFEEEKSKLDEQVVHLIEYTTKNKFNTVNIYKEIASGLDEDRQELLKMLDEIKNKDIYYLIVESEDTLTKSGYKFLQKYCEANNVYIITTNDPNGIKFF